MRRSVILQLLDKLGNEFLAAVLADRFRLWCFDRKAVGFHGRARALGFALLLLAGPAVFLGDRHVGCFFVRVVREIVVVVFC